MTLSLSPPIPPPAPLSGHQECTVGGPAYRRAAEGVWDTTDSWGVRWPVQVRSDRGGVLLGQRHGETWTIVIMYLDQTFSSLMKFSPCVLLCSCPVPAPAVRRDRAAHRRPGGHRGPLHPAPGRGAEGGATGRPHRGRLRAGEQDGEGLASHPQGHRLYRLSLHPLRRGGKERRTVNYKTVEVGCMEEVQWWWTGKKPQQMCLQNMSMFTWWMSYQEEWNYF